MAPFSPVSVSETVSDAGVSLAADFLEAFAEAFSDLEEEVLVTFLEDEVLADFVDIFLEVSLVAFRAGIFVSISAWDVSNVEISFEIFYGAKAISKDYYVNNILRTSVIIVIRSSPTTS